MHPVFYLSCQTSRRYPASCTGGRTASQTHPCQCTCAVLPSIITTFPGIKKDRISAICLRNPYSGELISAHHFSFFPVFQSYPIFAAILRAACVEVLSGCPCAFSIMRSTRVLSRLFPEATRFWYSFLAASRFS